MDLMPLVPRDRPIVQGYGNGGFRISGQWFSGAVALFPDRALELEETGSGMVSDSLLDRIASESPPLEVLFVGRGDAGADITLAQRRRLGESGISVEVIQTSPACSSFNFLQAEGRRVGAILFPVG